MFVIGLLLLAAAIVVGIDIAVMNDTKVDLEAFNQTWTSSPGAAFVVGVITAVVGLVGLWLMINGMRRMRARRRERRAIVEERDRLAAERQREIDAMSAAGRGDRGRDGMDGAVDDTHTGEPERVREGERVREPVRDREFSNRETATDRNRTGETVDLRDREPSAD